MSDKKSEKNLFETTKYISYNTNCIETLKYVVYYEVDKQGLIVKNKIVVFYLSENKDFFKKLSDDIMQINKIHITKQDLNKILKGVDINFVELTIYHDTHKKSSIRRLLETRFAFMKDKTIKKGVIKGGIIPTKYLSRRLP